MNSYRSKVSKSVLLAVTALVVSMLACEVQLADSTPTAGGTTSGACDDSRLRVRRQSVPDGTTVKAGQEFTKTWRIANRGTCAWSAGYRLALVGR